MAHNPEEATARVSRWTPLSELELFDPFNRQARRRGLLSEFFGEGAGGSRGFVPAVDVAENDEEYVVTAELAGAKRDDMTLEVHENILTIRGEKRSEREEEKDQMRYVERSFGSFSRSFTLPSNADSSRLDASFNDGVLTVRVPKREEAKPRVINIGS